jgi:hypothetical protein
MDFEEPLASHQGGFFVQILTYIFLGGMDVNKCGWDQEGKGRDSLATMTKQTPIYEKGQVKLTRAL